MVCTPTEALGFLGSPSGIVPTSTGRGPMPTSTGRGPVPISFPAEGLPTGATALALVPTELLGFVTKYVGACFRCNVLLFVFDGNADLFFKIGLDQFFLQPSPHLLV